MEDEHLAVAINTCPDADGRYTKRLMYFLGKRSRHRLEHDGEGPCILNCPGISQDLLARGLVLALDLEPAEDMYVLRGQSYVRHDRDAGV